MDSLLLAVARGAIGFMPDDEGLALHDAALGAVGHGPLLEIGSYCGKSSVYLGAAARDAGTVVFSVDHHRGSEEQQPGWEHHDERLVDPVTGRIDTWPWWRATIVGAGLSGVVIGIVGDSPAVAQRWSAPLGLVFVDGGHAPDVVRADYEGWAPHVAPGGSLVFHDVFEDPADGGHGPYETWCRAVADGFEPVSSTGSLRVLRRGPRAR